MKTRLLAFLSFVCVSAFASPNFVTPSMVKRNGLTDEQYQQLWAQGKHPRITQAAARDWIFRAHRFANVTNWLDVIGRTNDYARLVYPTMTTNEMLTATNRVLKVTVSALENHVETLTDAVHELTEELEVAEQDAKVTREIQKAVKRTEKNLEKVVKTIEQARKKAADEDEEALWNALLAILEGRDPNGTEGE